LASIVYVYIDLLGILTQVCLEVWD